MSEFTRFGVSECDRERWEEKRDAPVWLFHVSRTITHDLYLYFFNFIF